MTHKECVDLMKDRGFVETVFTKSGDDVVTACFHNGSGLSGVTVFIPSGKFEVRYVNTKGGLILSSGMCSPITAEEHFRKFYNLVEIGARALLKAF